MEKTKARHFIFWGGLFFIVSLWERLITRESLSMLMALILLWPEKSWKKYYWLDMVRLFEKFMRPGQELLAVKYFSARPDSTERSLRQNAFFQANLENPKFHLILGKFLKKDITCFRCGNVIILMKRKKRMCELLRK